VQLLATEALAAVAAVLEALVELPALIPQIAEMAA
jgi:hypothetical protein